MARFVRLLAQRLLRRHRGCQFRPLSGHTGTHLRWTPFTYLFNMTGRPAATVPCGWLDSGLPVALQIVGHRFDDVKVLQAARAWNQLQSWADKWSRMARESTNEE